MPLTWSSSLSESSSDGGDGVCIVQTAYIIITVTLYCVFFSLTSVIFNELQWHLNLMVWAGMVLKLCKLVWWTGMVLNFERLKEFIDRCTPNKFPIVVRFQVKGKFTKVVSAKCVPYFIVFMWLWGWCVIVTVKLHFS